MERFNNSKSFEEENEKRPKTRLENPGPGKYNTNFSDFDRPNTGTKFGSGTRTALTKYDEASRPGPIYLPNVQRKENVSKFSTAGSTEKRAET